MDDYHKNYSDKIGSVVEWDGKKWLIDNTDDDFKEEDEETSLFLLPEKYAKAEELKKLFKTGDPDKVGWWVKASEIFGKDDM